WSTSKTPSYTKSVSWQHHPKLIANKRRLLEIMLMLIICEIVNKRYSFSVVAQNNENCVKKGKKNRMRGIRLK
ncbi:hypothetical protein, partial [Escherichia coli]|uniref:hypothetical protein n=1 Tax=Escherichia coli TaxID=562 RepID=UPI0030C6D787